jgi:hypothetical protein
MICEFFKNSTNQIIFKYIKSIKMKALILSVLFLILLSNEVFSQPELYRRNHVFIEGNQNYEFQHFKSIKSIKSIDGNIASLYLKTLADKSGSQTVSFIIFNDVGDIIRKTEIDYNINNKISGMDIEIKDENNYNFIVFFKEKKLTDSLLIIHSYTTGKDLKQTTLFSKDTFQVQTSSNSMINNNRIHFVNFDQNTQKLIYYSFNPLNKELKEFEITSNEEFKNEIEYGFVSEINIIGFEEKDIIVKIKAAYPSFHEDSFFLRVNLENRIIFKTMVGSNEQSDYIPYLDVYCGNNLIAVIWNNYVKNKKSVQYLSPLAPAPEINLIEFDHEISSIHFGNNKFYLLSGNSVFNYDSNFLRPWIYYHSTISDTNSSLNDVVFLNKDTIAILGGFSYLDKNLNKKLNNNIFLLLQNIMTDVKDETIKDNSDIVVSPNPATDYIEISSFNPTLKRGVDTDYDIQIFDMLGIIVSTPYCFAVTPASGGQRIDVSYLSPGIYFLKIGNRVEKFVKI